MEIDPKIIISLLSVFRTPIEQAIKSVKQSFEKFYDQGIKSYLEKTFEEICTTKTFINKDPQPFYEIFFPISLSDGNKNVYDSQESIFLFESSKRITIIGSAGGGKSLLSKHIFLDSINKQLGIPILINLRDFNDFDDGFEDFIHFKIFNYKMFKYDNTWKKSDTTDMEFQSQKQENLFVKAIGTGKFIFILDGYDEIFSERKNRITSEIKWFVEKHRLNKFIITSRPGTNVEYFPGFNNLYVNELSQPQINEFINFQLKDNLTFAREIAETIDNYENKDYKTLLTNPLLLSMFIMTYELHPELPSSKSQFYWNVFDTLYTKHDSRKEPGFKHEKISGLEKEDYFKLLCWISYLSYFDGSYRFTGRQFEKISQLSLEHLELTTNTEHLLYDLEVSIGLIIKDGLEFTFPHKSIQEYFTASCIAELSDDGKSKVYEEKFIELFMSANELTNFWKLCLELDEYSFKQHFILINLKRILKNSEGKTSYEAVRNCLKFLNVKHTLKRFLNHNNYSWEPVEFLDSIEVNILGLIWKEWSYFFSVNNIRIEGGTLVWNYFEESGKMDNYFGVQYYTINYQDHFSEELFSLLKQVGVVSQVEEFLSNLRTIISKMEIEFGRNQESELRLLGIPKTIKDANKQ